VLRGLFITGTDTGVGKTVVSAALIHRYRAQALLRYWKPIQTGIEHDDDTAEVQRLANYRPDEVFTSGVRLRQPVSPHLAATLSGTTIALEPLNESVRSQPPSNRWIVEGAGGVLVPINGFETMVDLMTVLGLPVVVVTRTSLGTINHTLLTLEAVRRRTIRVVGVVMVGPPHPDNRAAIERYGEVAVLGEMPCFGSLESAQLASWAATELDPDQHLLEFLR
jgi:dethiobiotin synthetase